MKLILLTLMIIGIGVVKGDDTPPPQSPSINGSQIVEVTSSKSKNFIIIIILNLNLHLSSRTSSPSLPNASSSWREFSRSPFPALWS